MQRKDNNMSDTDEERELLSDQIVDKKHFTMIWNWFGYFKNDKAQKTTVCVYMSSDVSTKTGNTINLLKHLKRSRPSDYTWG